MMLNLGAIKNSSTVHALVDVVHDWAVTTDFSDKMIRALLLDYRKAFDLIDHGILMNKLGQLGLPGFIASCVAASRPPAERESDGGGAPQCLGASAWRGSTGNSRWPHCVPFHR